MIAAAWRQAPLWSALTTPWYDPYLGGPMTDTFDRLKPALANRRAGKQGTVRPRGFSQL